MHRTRTSRATAGLMGAAVVLTLSLLSAHPANASATAEPTSSPQPTQPSGPAYPTITPTEPGPPNLEEWEREVPSVTTRTEHLDLAIMDELEGEIDADALVAAVGKLEMGQRRILVAVDREPAGSPHARSLAGSMIMMVHPEILRDDWLDVEHGGHLVGEDWSIITVILPQTPGSGPVDVFFQEGTNVDLDGTTEEVTAAIASAGEDPFAQGDYTGGIEAMITTAVDRTSIQPSPWPWLLGALGAVVLLILGWLGVRGLMRSGAGQRRYRQAVASGQDLTELLGEESRPRMRRLERMAQTPASILAPLEIPDDGTLGALDGSALPGVGAVRGVVRGRLERQLRRLPATLEQVEQRAVQRTIAPEDDHELAARLDCAAEAYERLGTVLTHGVAADPVVVKMIMTAHRARLSDLNRLTRQHRVSGFRNGPKALQMVVDHTHELDEVSAILDREVGQGQDPAGSGLGGLLRRLRGRQDAPSEAAAHPGVVAGQLLDRLEAMRVDAERVSVALVVQGGEDVHLRRDEDVWEASDPLVDLHRAETLETAGGPASRGRSRGWRARRGDRT